MSSSPRPQWVTNRYMQTLVRDLHLAADLVARVRTSPVRPEDDPEQHLHGFVALFDQLKDLASTYVGIILGCWTVTRASGRVNGVETSQGVVFAPDQAKRADSLLARWRALEPAVDPGSGLPTSTSWGHLGHLGEEARALGLEILRQSNELLTPPIADEP